MTVIVPKDLVAVKYVGNTRIQTHRTLPYFAGSHAKAECIVIDRFTLIRYVIFAPFFTINSMVGRLHRCTWMEKPVFSSLQIFSSPMMLYDLRRNWASICLDNSGNTFGIEIRITDPVSKFLITLLSRQYNSILLHNLFHRYYKQGRF